jgi:hypothetical protein
MNICKNCGVELEDNMQTCPLCGQPANADNVKKTASQQPLLYTGQMTAPQKKFTWEIVSLILLSAIVVTFILNFIINKRITWSEYPMAISLIIFSYLSLFAFWRQRTIILLMVGFVLSSGCILALDLITGGISWALWLGIPLLLAATVIVIMLLVIIDSASHKGVNLLAWGFLGAGLLCICIEGILSYYQVNQLNLTWSVIVGACVIPVSLVLLFVHFRLKKGRSLKKTFHV